MNCPSRTEEPAGTGFNQNPSALAADLTTRQDLNGIANARVLRRMQDPESRSENALQSDLDVVPPAGKRGREMVGEAMGDGRLRVGSAGERGFDGARDSVDAGSAGTGAVTVSPAWFKRLRKVMLTFGKFVGPGFMVRILFIPSGQLYS